MKIWDKPLKPLPYCLPLSRPSFPSCVQSAIRPNLSPFEYGAYGTPSRVVDALISGPHSSSRLSCAIVLARLIPGILAVLGVRKRCMRSVQNSGTRRKRRLSSQAKISQTSCGMLRPYYLRHEVYPPGFVLKYMSQPTSTLYESGFSGQRPKSLVVSPFSRTS